MSYASSQLFEKKDFRKEPLAFIEFEDCTFLNCDFSSLKLSRMKFVDCAFTGCNLSNAILHEAVFSEVVFTDCKLIGLHFEDCQDFGSTYRFERCQLDYSSFIGRNLKGMVFTGCRLWEADFTECNLSRSRFDDCDLLNARFDHTNLEEADFRTAYQYSIRPTANRLKKAKFSLPGALGLLDEFGVVVM